MKRLEIARWVGADLWYGLRWELKSLRRTALAPEYGSGSGGRIPVVLIPGVFEPWRFLQPIIDALHEGGHPVHVVSSLGFNSGEIPEMASRVRRQVEDDGLSGGDGLALVGHSKGGLIGKQLLAHHNEDGLFRHLVAVNSPFSGSSLARFVPLRAVRVFAPGGELLRTLTGLEDVNRRITSIYARIDPNIPGSSHLPGAQNIVVDTVGHFRLLADPRLGSALLEVLSQVDRSTVRAREQGPGSPPDAEPRERDSRTTRRFL